MTRTRAEKEHGTVIIIRRLTHVTEEMRGQVEERGHSLRHAKQEDTATPFELLSKKKKSMEKENDKEKKILTLDCTVLWRQQQ